MVSPLTNGLNLIQKQFASFFFPSYFEHVHTTGFDTEMRQGATQCHWGRLEMFKVC